MLCPHCKKEIDTVNVFSQCYQKADLVGNKVVNYGSVEGVLETLDIECPECSMSLLEDVEEET